MASARSPDPRAPRAPQLLLLLLLLLLSPGSAATTALGPGPSQAGALPRPPNCGRPRLQGKVLGGTDAPEGKWPWQASLHYIGSHICGASIISSHWVLTAAHCFEKNWNIKAYDVYVGLVNLQVRGKYTQWFEIHTVILHPTYKLFHPIGGDIALVQLKTSIVFSDFVLPVCLAPPDVQLSNLTCWATGWGIVSQQGDTSSMLQEARLPLIPKLLCQLLYSYMSYVLPDMLCAGDLEDLKTVCEGDSGGPLVCEFNNIWMQVGSVSWGHGCLAPVYPAVYARISYFSKWIRDQVEKTPPPPQPLPLPALSPTRGTTVSVLLAVLRGYS
ncbi:serine protease 38, partial [Suncus etruscus]|uniref:serine protease 38 n=1 Tax=Suncus etruscus TaxID=109475 RepID=UPI00210FA27C